MKYILSLFLFLVLTRWVSAQSYERYKEIPYKWAVRFNVLGMLDPLDGNISAGGEYIFHPRWSVTTDLSFILYSAYLPQNKSAIGFMLKPAIRFYTSESRKGFLEATLFYKQVGYKLEDWLGKGFVNGVPAYEEYQDFIFRKRVGGINLQAGLQANLSKDKLLRLETWFGLGIRFKWQDIKNHPDASYQTNRIFLTDLTREYYVAPSIPFGVRLVYCIQ